MVPVVRVVPEFTPPSDRPRSGGGWPVSCVAWRVPAWELCGGAAAQHWSP